MSTGNGENNLQPNGKRGEFLTEFKDILTTLIESDKDIAKLEFDDVNEVRKRVKSNFREVIEKMKLLSSKI